MQLPQHEQLWPNKLLPHRLEEYVMDDGSPPTQNRAFAKRVTGQHVLDAVIAAQQALGLNNIDPRYFVGTCFHEAGCANEWDTEVATPSCPPGFVSVGAFQIGEEEANRFGFQLKDMLDLSSSVSCMIKLAEYNRRQLRGYAAIGGPSVPDPDYTDDKGSFWVGGTMRAYLAIAHNHGLGYAAATIKNYGMDWGGYIKRNPLDNIVSHGYGQDCVTGGPYYPTQPAPAEPLGGRALLLKSPNMTGEDVRELQRHLKVSPDGVFGTATDTALRAFKKLQGLLDDGICDPQTWTAVLKQ